MATGPLAERPQVAADAGNQVPNNAVWQPQPIVTVNRQQSCARGRLSGTPTNRHRPRCFPSKEMHFSSNRRSGVNCHAACRGTHYPQLRRASAVCLVCSGYGIVSTLEVFPRDIEACANSNSLPCWTEVLQTARCSRTKAALLVKGQKSACQNAVAIRQQPALVPPQKCAFNFIRSHRLAVP